MSTTSERSDGFAIVDPDKAKDYYEGSDVPGEFRRLTSSLHCRQLSVTLIRVPPHSDFEQGTGHFHREVEEVYLITRGTLTMRFGDEIRRVSAPAAVKVDPSTPRSHRNEGDDPVDLWAISKRVDEPDATKIDEFWDASAEARQTRA
jgi:mannose-6-phosphate isomerase-like protein (cupin superfamily)